jgi:hypothetical protein
MLVRLTAVLAATLAVTSCSPSAITTEDDDGLAKDGTTVSIVELTTTTTLPRTTTTRPARIVAEELAYESCKTWREAELQMGDVFFGAYPYVNEAQANLMMFSMATRAKSEMEAAAAVDASFRVFSKSIERFAQVLWEDYQVSKGNRRPGSNDETIGSKFFDLCTDYGIWPSSPGKFPPIEREPRKPEQTSLNGARKVCQDVFYISPDGVVYDGNDSFTLNECDALARSVAQSAESFSDARSEMKRRVFGWRDSWCWGRICRGRFDVMG